MTKANAKEKQGEFICFSITKANAKTNLQIFICNLFVWMVLNLRTPRLLQTHKKARLGISMKMPTRYPRPEILEPRKNAPNMLRKYQINTPKTPTMPVLGISLVFSGCFLRVPEFRAGGRFLGHFVVDIPGLAIWGLCGRPGFLNTELIPPKDLPVMTTRFPRHLVGIAPQLSHYYVINRKNAVM